MSTSAIDDGIHRERRDLRRGAWQILTGFGVRSVARILLIVFVAKLYGVSDFGRLGETVAIIELAAALATFGLNKTLLGALASSPAESHGTLVREALLLALGISLVSVALLYALWPLVMERGSASTSFAICGVPLIALTEVALTATRHFRTVSWDTFVKAVVKPWSFLAMAAAGYFWMRGGGEETLTSGQMIILAYIASLLLSAVIALIALARTMGRSVIAPSGSSTIGGVYRLARSSLPIAISETAVFAFRRIDIIILALVAGPSATGVYYLAQQIGTVVEKMRYLFEPMLAPIIAQSVSLAPIGYHLRRLCVFVFAVQIPIICLIALFGPPALGWLGSAFLGGLSVILIVLAGELVDGSFGLSELPMVYRDPQWPPRTVVLALGIEIALVAILASQFGAIGAAIGFAAAMAVLACMRIALVHRLYRFRLMSFGYLVVAIVAVAAGIAAISATAGLGGAPIVGVFLFLAIYACGAWLWFRVLQPRTPDTDVSLMVENG